MKFSFYDSPLKKIKTFRKSFLKSLFCGVLGVCVTQIALNHLKKTKQNTKKIHKK